MLITPREERFLNRQGQAIEIRDIVGESFILREKGSATRDSFEKALRDEGIAYSSVNIAARMNSMEAIKQAVRGGMGISIISEVAAEKDSIDRGYLVFDIDGYDGGREFYMVYDDRFTMSPTAETFKFFVLEKYRHEIEGQEGS